jgi:hypothetical protein
MKWLTPLLCFRKRYSVELEEQGSRVVDRSKLRLEAIEAFHNHGNQSDSKRYSKIRRDPIQHRKTQTGSYEDAIDPPHQSWSIELVPALIDTIPHSLPNIQSQTHINQVANQAPYGICGWNHQTETKSKEVLPQIHVDKNDKEPKFSVPDKKKTRNIQGCFQPRGCWGPTTTMRLDQSYSLVASPSDSNSILMYRTADGYHYDPSSPFLRMNSEVSRDVSMMEGYYMCLPPATLRDS